ncbi:hypothetical protein AB0K80_06765 [Streptomyces sp. NPDC052682]|uniref:hypothetical protein n=1 Tax=Streptomyces sp. NPDC052682 TaxID=3154954 RepID=UPI00343295B2
MGDRQSDGGLTGRRRVHPGGSAAGPGVRRAVPESAALEALLVATLRGGVIDAEAEQRAVAAFRAARQAGAQGARTRRRDDWRPARPRRTGRSVRTALSVALASLTLGGVAVAAIGVADSDNDRAGGERQHTTRPATGTTRPREAGPSASPSHPGSGPSGRPGTAQDTEAQCRAYEQVEGRGRALDATAWERLVAAAGGERHVAAYCARALADAAADDRPGRANGTPAPGNSAAGNQPAAPGPGNGKETGRADGNGQEPPQHQNGDQGQSDGNGGSDGNGNRADGGKKP